MEDIERLSLTCLPVTRVGHIMSIYLVNVGFTEVVPTVGRERGLISNRYTVTIRMISAFRWANDVSHFNLSLIVQGQSHETVSINHIC